MSDIRSATLSIKVIGDALADIQNILNLYTKLEEKGKNPLVLKVDVATQNNVQAMNQASNQIKKMRELYQTLSSNQKTQKVSRKIFNRTSSEEFKKLLLTENHQKVLNGNTTQNI